MKYEKCKVILVETREKNGTFKVSPSGKMYPCYIYSNTWSGFKFYHMMICSYEPAFNSDIKVYDLETNSMLKVIATTNENLNLPRPSNEFIVKFAKENGNISEILVEYETLKRVQNSTNYELDDIIDEDGEKIASIDRFEPYKLTILKIAKDNTITIRKIKSEFTRKEVLTLLKQAYDFGKKYHHKTIDEKAYFNYIIDEI